MIELTDEQKRKGFWTWVYCNALTHMPEAKRFLGNSDTEHDFKELTGLTEEPTEQQTTEMMAQVIEWGILQAAKETGDDPYFIHDTPAQLREHIMKETKERRY